jgi:hypothetical protein
MKQLFFFSVFSFAIVFSSCQKEQDEPVAFTQVFGIEDFERAKQEIGNYALIGVYADGVSKIWFNKFHGNKTGQILINYRPEPNGEIGDGGTYKAGGITATFNGNYYDIDGDNAELSQPTPEGWEKLKALTGKEVEFSLERDGKYIYKENLYLPDPMEVGALGADGYISRNGNNITWDQDSNNENGVLAVLIWKNQTLQDIVPKSPFHYKAALMDDTGNGVLPSSFFEGVPKDAFFDIWFMRGHIEIVQGTDGRTYKIYSVSEDVKEFVMKD